MSQSFSSFDVAEAAARVVNSIDVEEDAGGMSSREAVYSKAAIVALIRMLGVKVKFVSKETGLPIVLDGEEETPAPRRLN